MNNKFYVTFKTAKLLKEKGFNKIVDKLIHLNRYNISIIESPEKYYDESEVYNDYLYLKQNHYACPTKAEAIDWLESKGIMIDIHWIRFNENRRWNYSIFDCRTCDTIDIKYIYTTRLEAEEAAIIKACKLLENGN